MWHLVYDFGTLGRMELAEQDAQYQAFRCLAHAGSCEHMSDRRAAVAAQTRSTAALLSISGLLPSLVPGSPSFSCRSTLFVCTSGTFFSSAGMNVLADATMTLAGVMYPAFATYKSVQQKSPQNRLIWCRYWVVFAVFFALKTVGDVILFWLPFYYLVQVLLILWISSSKASGAQIVYAYAIVPLLKDREQSIDRLITRVKRDASLLFWQTASAVGIHWSSTFCHIIRLYVQAAYADQTASGVPSLQSAAADNGVQIVELAEEPAKDEEMYSEEEADGIRGVSGERSLKKGHKKRTSVKPGNGKNEDCNSNVAGDHC